MMTKKLFPVSLFLYLISVFLTFYSLTIQAGPFAANECTADRHGVDVGCTANDVNITRIDVISGSVKQCTAGTTATLGFDLTVNFAVPDRWDVGIFLVNDGKDPHKTSGKVWPNVPGGTANNNGPKSCSVGILDKAPFIDLDGAIIGYPTDKCLDGNGAIGGSGVPPETSILGEGIKTMTGVNVLCRANPYSDGKLIVPFVVTWDNQATPSGAICVDNTDPVPNTYAKCNSPNQSNPLDVCKETVQVVVMPEFTKTADKSTVAIGDIVTYTVTLKNNAKDPDTNEDLTSNISNAVFKDPAVANLSIVNYDTTKQIDCTYTGTTNICSLIGGALTIANMQSSGIVIPSLPQGSTMTFKFRGKITGGSNGTVIPNTATLDVTAVSGYCPSSPITGTSTAEAKVTVGASPKLTLIKRVINNDGGTALPTDFILTATGPTVASGTVKAPITTIDANTKEATAFSNVTVSSGAYDLSETTLTGQPVKGYGAAPTWTCTGAKAFSGSQVTLEAGNDATCTAINNDDAAKLTIRKTTKAPTPALGAGTFKFNGYDNPSTAGVNEANGIPTGDVLTVTTTTTETKPTTQIALGSSGVDTIFTETLPADNTWVITAASCTDENGAATGNGTGAFNVPFNQTGSTATISGITIPANGIAIPASKVKGGAILVCDVTNSRRTITLTKEFVPSSGTILNLQINGTISASGITGIGGTTPPVAVSGSPFTLNETATSGALYSGSDKRVLFYSCVDGKGNQIVNTAIVDLASFTSSYTTPSFTPPTLGTGSAALDDQNLNITCEMKNVGDGSVVIKKVSIPYSTQAFSYTVSGTGTLNSPLAPGSSFTLYGTNSGIAYNGTTCATNNCNIIAANGTMNNNQTFIFTENVPADWTLLSATCVTASATGVGVSGSALTLTGSSGTDYAMCTFTNKQKTAITVKKVVIGNTTDTFNLQVNGSNVNVTGPVGSLQIGTANYKNGDFAKVILGTGVFSPSVSETINSNYTTTLTCTDDNTGQPVSGINKLNYTGGNQTVSLNDAQQATCTFTNTRKIFLTAAKNVVSRSVSSDEFTVSINNGGPSADTPDTDGTPNTKSTTPFSATKDVEYTFQEVGIAGADLSKYDSTYTCTNTLAGSATVLPPANSAGTSVKITPKSDGDNITCTFTNTAKPASVKLTKTTLGGTAGVFNFNLTNTTQATGAVTTTADGTPEQVDGDTALAGIQNFKVSSLNTAIDITESALSGWTMTSAGCSGLKDTDKATVDLPNRKLTIPLTSVVSSASIECNFNNSKNTTVTVKKTLVPNTNIGKFDLKIYDETSKKTENLTSNIGDGGTTAAVQVTPGDVITVSEEGHAGTILANYTTSLTCVDTTSSTTIINAQPFTSGSFIPTIGHDIQCTFTNSQPPKLKLVKQTVGSAASGDTFKIAINQGATEKVATTVDTTDTYGSTSTFVGVSGTTYTFKETAVGATNLSNYTTAFSCTNNGSTYTSFSKSDDYTYTITPADTDNITCKFINTAKSMGTITLTKALAIPRKNAGDQFTVQIKNSSNVIVNSVSRSTTTGSGSTITSGTGTGSYTGLPGTYTLTEVAASPAPMVLTDYKAKLTCTNKGVAMTAPYDGSSVFTAGTPQTIPLAAGDDIACILANGDFVSTGVPLTIEKTTVGGTGIFGFTVTNGANPTASIDTTVSNPNSSTVNLSGIGSSAIVTETAVAGWALTSASCTDGTTTWNAAGNSVTIPSIAASGKTYSCKFANKKTGPAITGTVFKDTGKTVAPAIGGVANDGIKNGSETGIPKVTVKLTDCAAAPATEIYSTAVTDANGNYSLAIPQKAIDDAKLVCVEETNAAGYLSTGSNVNDSRTPANYALEADKIKFNQVLAADTSYSSLNFADVPESRFLTDGSKTGQPGTTVSYPHTFIAGSEGAVTFSILSSTSVPNMTGWSQTLYKDKDCNGILDTGAGDTLIPSSAISVAADEKICLILKEFIPATAPLGASNLVKIQAYFEYTGETPDGLTGTYIRQDLTRVTDVALDLLKMVRLEGETDWLTSNTAKSGQVLEYQLTYTNNAPTPINNLVVNDATPAYTTFVSAACGTTPSGLTCGTPTGPTSGSTGGIQWTFTGKLAPGASGTVTFKVKVD